MSWQYHLYFLELPNECEINLTTFASTSVQVFPHHHSFAPVRTTPPHSCSPSCSLTPEPCLCSSASQAQADASRLPSSTAVACTQDLPPHPRVHIPKSAHTHQTPHLHTASLSILSWRWDETQRVPFVQALKVPESF